MHHIEHEGRRIEFDLRYSRRRKKSISIRISRDGDVICSAPERASQAYIHAVIRKRAHWIARHLSRFEAQASVPAPTYRHGEKHLYMGRALALEVAKSTSRRISVEARDASIRIVSRHTGADAIRNALLAWYRRQALTLFNERVQKIMAEIPWLQGQEVPELRVRRMKSRWGSCSSQGVITLNLHLIKAPLRCIDYVITHELCHLQEHNHGPRFYALLTQQMPEWKQIKRELEDNPEILR
ncbi:MAG TPA: SprT family zinc-dependent metalloprotease [Mariprofundaceae bacterium]|nr:SprT family zinc-dependent metalloprotease [Mariprofundaceae bacterium]